MCEFMKGDIVEIIDNGRSSPIKHAFHVGQVGVVLTTEEDPLVYADDLENGGQWTQFVCDQDLWKIG